MWPSCLWKYNPIKGCCDLSGSLVCRVLSFPLPYSNPYRMGNLQGKFYFTLSVDKETEAEQMMEVGLELRTPPSQFSILPKLVAIMWPLLLLPIPALGLQLRSKCLHF